MHRSVILAILLSTAVSNGQLNLKNDLKAKFLITTAAPFAQPNLTPDGSFCSCAVFLSGQFKKGSSEQPRGLPALTQETDMQYPCNPTGTKMCINKCLELIVKHLPNSAQIICGTIDRDIVKERASLWVQNCNSSTWINSNLSAGREYCCKNGESLSCLEPLKIWSSAGKSR